jgi:hypothetical protein
MPALSIRQLLRSFDEFTEEARDFCKCVRCKQSFAVRPRYFERCLACMPNPSSDRVQQQWTAGDGFHMAIRLG